MSKIGKTYNQHFRLEWLRDVRFENWLMPIEGDSLKCICKFCKSILWAKLSDIDRHRKTRKHQNRSGVFFPDESNLVVKEKIDEEKLVSIVKENIEVYDGKQHNKELIATIWKRIAEELESTEAEVRKKWCVIRSNYIQERKKAANNFTGEPISSWPLFDSLKFLDNYLRQYTSSKEIIPSAKQILLEKITKKELLKSCLENSDYNPNEPMNNNNNLGTGIPSYGDNLEMESSSYGNNLGTVTSTNGICIATETPSNVNKLSTEAQLNGYIVDKSNKTKGATTKILRLLNQIADKTADDNDTDILFLRSLLPLIKKLGTVENLEFKEEVIQLLKRKLQQQSNTICFTPNTNSVAICYGDQRSAVPTSSQNHVENSAETIIIYPQHP